MGVGVEGRGWGVSYLVLSLLEYWNGILEASTNSPVFLVSRRFLYVVAQTKLFRYAVHFSAQRSVFSHKCEPCFLILKTTLVARALLYGMRGGHRREKPFGNIGIFLSFCRAFFSGALLT